MKYQNHTLDHKVCYLCLYLYLNIVLSTADRAQSNVRTSLRGGFLSSSARSAPPRDIMLEEPDITNPGTIYTVRTYI